MNSDFKTLRIDLHCHSWASDRPSLWLMQRLGCPESFTAPELVREIARQRDMDFVTITDHNTIDGVREIEKYDNVIRGEEVTTYFPGEAKIHVVCLGHTDKQHQEIHRLREDIFTLAHYLNAENIVHFCAHPLHAVNGKLTWELFETLLLLFKRFETLNGSRLRKLNWITEQILTHLTAGDLERLADKHGIRPVGERPWEKQIVGGSDDHSGLFIGTCYTEVSAAVPTREGVLNALRQGRSRPCGGSDGCLTLAHQVNSIAYQYYRSKIGRESEELLLILGRIFEHNRPFKIHSSFHIRKKLKRIFKYFRKPKGANVNLIEEIREVISSNTALKSLFHEGLMSREEYNTNVFSLASDVMDEMIVRVFQKPQLLHYFIVFAPVLLASYFMTSRNLHGARNLIRRGETWLGIERPPKVAWFTDSFVNMDGVSKTCRTFLAAAQQREKNIQVVTSTSVDLSRQAGVVNFPPVKEFTTPGYERVMLYIPSILKVLKYVEDEDFDAVVVSTPGPLGLMGLICGKIMRIPVHGIYHTDFPRIALRVSGDPMFGELALLLTRMFYRQVDQVFTPSRWYREDIINLGIPEEHTRLLERWVDTRLFTPSRRKKGYWLSKQPKKLLYVGRISKDKNIDVLIRLYEDFVLHCVGDGPYFAEMCRKTAVMPRFIMTGAKFNEELADAYAASDLFVYPGLLDTFGNVVIEAQASGLPCVVMNEGGPQELILPGETGVVARSEEEFISAAEELLLDESRRQAMSAKAAEYAQERFAEEQIFTRFWEQVTGPVPEERNKPEFQFEPLRKDAKVVPLTA